MEVGQGDPYSAPLSQPQVPSLGQERGSPLMRGNEHGPTATEPEIELGKVAVQTLDPPSPLQTIPTEAA